ncbi:MAG: hypothetical protein MI867_29520, partial [Pseudomonadales bacterium]|nr:hypothetical protein [Pseudomonadales bacterium]
RRTRSPEYAMRRHYGQFLVSEGASQLAKLGNLDLDLDLAQDDEATSVEDEKVSVVRGGGLESHQEAQIAGFLKLPLGTVWHRGAPIVR